MSLASVITITRNPNAAQQLQLVNEIVNKYLNNANNLTSFDSKAREITNLMRNKPTVLKQNIDRLIIANRKRFIEHLAETTEIKETKIIKSCIRPVILASDEIIKCIIKTHKKQGSGTGDANANFSKAVNDCAQKGFVADNLQIFTKLYNSEMNESDIITYAQEIVEFTKLPQNVNKIAMTPLKFSQFESVASGEMKDSRYILPHYLFGGLNGSLVGNYGLKTKATQYERR
jgi:hypothetical protein